jgi:c-di-GMP phosphodiesterase
MDRILVSRQPIYCADWSQLGYELLFRTSDEDIASFSDGDQATAEVIINTFMDIGLDKMVGRHLAFINFDRNLVLGNYCECLPRERVVLEMLHTMDIDAAVINKLRVLRSREYRIAIDHSLWDRAQKGLFGDVADFVKVDLVKNDWNTVVKAVRDLKQHAVELIAEKVETREQFERCREMGFDHFQGYFFCRPQLMEGRRVPVSQLATIRLITKLNNPDLDINDVAQTISQDVALTYKLLRYINSAVFSLPRVVESIKQAVMLIGQEKIRLWASLMLFSTFENKSRDIVTTGAVRARMCEILAQALGMKNPERMFLAGLLSVLDALLDQPLEEVLPSLSLAPDLVEALLHHSGDLGIILSGVIEYERRNWLQAQALLNVKDSVIQDAYRKSVAWSLTTLIGFTGTTNVTSRPAV